MDNKTRSKVVVQRNEALYADAVCNHNDRTLPITPEEVLTQAAERRELLDKLMHEARIMHEAVASTRVRRHKPLQRAARFADLVPFPACRKKLKKLLADEQHDIAELYRAGRSNVARWRELAAWGWVMWYAVRAPFSTTLIALLVKKFSIGG